MNKICSRCNQTLLIENFGRNKHTRDGVSYWCKPCSKKNSDEQYAKNREARIEQQKTRQASSKEKKADYDKQWRIKNQEELVQRDALYYREHKEQINQKAKERRKTDPIFKLVGHLRSRLHTILTQVNLPKTKKMPEYLGCTLPELKVHLEKQFTEGMTWENQGEWHLDHKIPLDAAGVWNLDKTISIELTEPRVYQLCHYTNLQPLWGSDNIRKSNKLLE